MMVCFYGGFLFAVAQNKDDFQNYRDKVKSEFREFRKSKKNEFESFRKSRNEEFSTFLALSWKNYSSFSSKKPVERPEPITPVVYDNRKPQKAPVKLPNPQLVLPKFIIEDIPLTVVPMKEPKPHEKLSWLQFYNTNCAIHDLPGGNIRLENLSEQAISKCWKELSADRYEVWTDDCVRLRSELNLCDWAYVKLVENVSVHLFPAALDIQAIVSTFLLVQSGYDVRLCRMGQNLKMLVHPDSQLFQLRYYVINGKEYYPTQPIEQGQNIQTYSSDFSEKSIPIRMVMNKYPKFVVNESEKRVYTSKVWKDAIPFQVFVNPSVIRFYRDYPRCEWSLYGQAALSPEFKEQVVSVLRKLITGKSQQEAANLLINYVQYGFDYKTDHEQFGYEKPFFIDENFYYPFNDCEDRAILYAKLIKELLGVEVVYLHYPEHLATAVLFTEQVKGDFVTIDEKQYIVCDPTYIGASIGQTMPQFKSVKAQAIRL